MSRPGERQSDRVFQRNQRIKIATASVVVLICGVWISYVTLSGRGVSVIKPSTPCEVLRASLGDLFDDLRFEYVELRPSEDGMTMTVGGSVASADDLSELKEKIRVAAERAMTNGDPVTLDWQVSVKR